MVDGPLKFVENVENNMNIVQKTQFGKDFSIVRVPYAFKLLMQELKTMNVQMRIITEDNVDRLTSLFYGEEIINEKTSESMTNNDYKMISDDKMKIQLIKQEKKSDENIKQIDMLPNDPILLKDMLEKIDPNMNVVELYFDAESSEWNIEGMKSDIDVFKDEQFNNESDEIGDPNKELGERHSNLSDNKEIGMMVMIWQDGQIDEDNFEIMGKSSDGRVTVRNVNRDGSAIGTKILQVEEKYIITKNSSLENPDALKIREDIDENKILDPLEELNTGFNSYTATQAPNFSTKID